MPELKETVLLYKAYKWFLGPSLLIGILALFFPLFYSLVPAHESGVCICNILVDGPNQIAILPIWNSGKVLRVINTLAYYFFNWFFLLALILMFNKIRHIKD